MASGQPIGFKAELHMNRGTLRARLEQILGGPVKLIPGGPTSTSVVGVVAGSAEGVAEVARSGVDTYITGEASHMSALLAEELGVNLLLGGHYATETLGVKALAAHLSEKFHVPWQFLDHPTGL